jgi:hypothetical protein
MKKDQPSGGGTLTRIRTALSVLAVFAILTDVRVAAANSMVERSKLEKMAETAKSPKEHVAVAKQYRLQAEQFEQEAVKHETEAQKLASAPRSPMAYKWPAMVGQPWVKKRQLAIEARRAARECLEASDRHMRLGVEALAEANHSRSSRSDGVD